MKKTILTFLFLFGLFYSKAQERFTQEVSAEYSVEYCDDCNIEPGVVPFTITVKHRKEENAMEKAKYAAVKAVLLKGIPGSPVSQPLISYTQYEQKKEWIDKFLDSKECHNFIGKTQVNPEKTVKIKSGLFKNGFEAGINVEVMYDNLKRFLTQNKVIKFGL
ncbi:MAG: hypothetical protein LCH67_08350 [Bacteroidetes bacterium]|nr:hypothetical protein [Bacteroidota bacterium]